MALKMLSLSSLDRWSRQLYEKLYSRLVAADAEKAQSDDYPAALVGSFQDSRSHSAKPSERGAMLAPVDSLPLSCCRRARAARCRCRCPLPPRAAARAEEARPQTAFGCAIGLAVGADALARRCPRARRWSASRASGWCPWRSRRRRVWSTAWPGRTAAPTPGAPGPASARRCSEAEARRLPRPGSPRAMWPATC